MKNYLFLLLAFSVITPSYSQILIKGYVKDKSKNSLESVYVIVEGTYKGTLTNSDGYYSINLNRDSSYIIKFSSIGYEKKEIKIHMENDSTISLDVTLAKITLELSSVEITASTFEAGDKGRRTNLTLVDVLTTGASNSDITSALKLVPGVQQVGEQSGLFVRGGDNDETKYYIDGLLIDQPYYSGASDISQRSRFSPSLFKGFAFSSGGYSASFGDALTAILSLESIDLPEKSSIYFNLGSVLIGAGTQILNKSKNSSFGIELGHTNLSPYYLIVKQKYKYFNFPGYSNVTLNYRKKYKNGIFKVLTLGDLNSVGIYKRDLDSLKLQDKFKYDGRYFVTLITNRLSFNASNYLNLGIGYSIQSDNAYFSLLDSSQNKVTLNDAYFESKNRTLERQLNTIQAKGEYVFTYKNSGRLDIGFHYFNFQNTFIYSGYKANLGDSYYSFFIENQYNIIKRIALKGGIRSEYSSMIGKYNIAPKIAAAFKISSTSDINISYGIYYQRPDMLKLVSYKYEDTYWIRARHLIGNINYSKNNRLLRLEYFNYKYSNLMKLVNTDTIGFKGTGNSSGIDLFYKDGTSINNLEFWITYSYLKAKRNFLDYPSLLMPTYTTPHTFSLVVKKFFNQINLQTNLSYTFSTGRPYYDIKYSNSNFKVFDKGITDPFHNICLSLNYLFNIKKIMGIAVLSCTNLLGKNPVLNYNFSDRILEDDKYYKEPITLGAPRFYFIGVFLNWGIDRRQNEIDKLLQQ